MSSQSHTLGGRRRCLLGLVLVLGNSFCEEGPSFRVNWDVRTRSFWRERGVLEPLLVTEQGLVANQVGNHPGTMAYTSEVNK